MFIRVPVALGEIKKYFFLKKFTTKIINDHNNDNNNLKNLEYFFVAIQNMKCCTYFPETILGRKNEYISDTKACKIAGRAV